MSLWKKELSTTSYESLKNDIKTDILIIGGGITGVNTLYFLKNFSHVVLVEANKIGMGVSANTTGKINYLQENTLGHLIQKKQDQKSKLYLQSQLEGMHLLKSIIEKEKIDCDLEEVSSYLVTEKKKYYSVLDHISHFLKEQSISVLEQIPNDLKRFQKGIGVTDTYVFHPLKYIYGLLSKLKNQEIYEHTKVVKIKKENDEFVCYTEQGFLIHAKRVLVTCHYPFFLFPYFLPIKTSIEKSYLVAKEVSKNLKYTYITMESPSLSSRFYETNDTAYQIFLGGSHKTFWKQNDMVHFDHLLQTFSCFNNSLFWSNVDIMTFDHLPIIGEIKPNFYVATGFHTWGMIESVVSAKLLSKLLNQESSVYEKLFSPKRSFWKRIVMIPYYLCVNAISFIRSKFYHKSWYSKSLSFSYKDGKLIACYVDSSNQKHFVHPVCPHMKCGLIFNEAELTWDCPCHSSRFDLDGNSIKGPSKYCISYKK